MAPTARTAPHRLAAAAPRAGPFWPTGTFLNLGGHEIEVLTAASRRAVPREFERLTRAYGADSVWRRARWRQAGILADTRTLTEIPPADTGATPDWPALRAIGQRWALLLKRIFEVDPLRCRRCGGQMRIRSFILDPDVITAILRHLHRKGRDPRALPEHAVAPAGRAPP